MSCLSFRSGDIASPGISSEFLELSREAAHAVTHHVTLLASMSRFSVLLIFL